MEVVKGNLRKERDKHKMGRDGVSFKYQVLVISWILVLDCTTGSHLPVTFDLSKNHSTTEGQVNVGHPVEKKESSFSSNCTDDRMTIVGTFAEKFKGRLYANDYSDEPDCGVVMSGNPMENVTLTLALGQCGIQMTRLDKNPVDPIELLHEVTVYVQYSSVLQQMSDERVTIYCLQKSQGQELSLDLDGGDISPSPSRRQGRRLKDGFSPTHPKIGEAVMEILAGKDPSPKSKHMTAIAVGEDVTLVISTKVLRGFDARIVNCTTHDGSRSSNLDGIRAQAILDSAGCSVDKLLVPNFRRRRLPVESVSSLITLHFVSFSAFKFPDRDHLHIQCSVAYCQGPCPHESCDSTVNHYGTWRDKYGRIADVLMETSSVVNSIEVLSPELDTPGGDNFDRHQSHQGASVTLNGPEPLVNNGPSPTIPRSLSSRRPLSTHYSKSPPVTFHPTQSFYSDGNGFSPRHEYGGPSVGVGMASTLTQYQVCISPGTVIIALVVLGLVLVISITATLWFALKRTEGRKYAESRSSAFSSPGPSPYYRFSQHGW